jgi:hypothetical protein
MERDTGEKSVAESGVERRGESVRQSEGEEKIPVNFAKYEGRIENVSFEFARTVADSAREIRNLIGELSAIVLFLRKSSSELSTSY